MADIAKYDLTHTIASYLDRHMVFPLLEFSQSRGVYATNDVLQAKLELLSKTKMVDFAMDIHKSLHETDAVPDEMTEHRAAVVAQIKEWSEKVDLNRLLTLLTEKTEELKELKEQKLLTPEYLEEKYELTNGVEAIELLYAYARFQFDCGNYSGAADCLASYRFLSTNDEKNFLALWGKLAAEILMQNWEVALEDLNRLREQIDMRAQNPLQTLQQRAWLIHWALFIFFNHPNGRNGIIELFFFQERYLNTIQTVCPHVLRYLTTAVITNKRRRMVLKDLVRVIQNESYTYRDPVTELLECLYVNFDFEAAQQKLRECEQVLQNDFFLVFCWEDFIENARLFIFETYCRIHQCIDISMLSEKLNMKQEDAERWIVNLIRNVRLDAKIDSAAGHVVMGAHHPSVHQQVIEKTKGLSFRSTLLASNLQQAKGGGGGGGGGGRGGDREQRGERGEHYNKGDKRDGRDNRDNRDNRGYNNNRGGDRRGGQRDNRGGGDRGDRERRDHHRDRQHQQQQHQPAAADAQA